MPVSDAGMRDVVIIEGHQAQPGEDTEIDLNIVALNYFETMGITLMRGRGFSAQDNESAPLVAIINEAMARRYWPDQDPIARKFRISGPKGPFIEIAGVVKTGIYRSIGEEPIPYIYLPSAQNQAGGFTIIVKTAGNPLALAAALRAEVHGLDGNLPVFDVKTMNGHIGEAISQERMIATLLGIFGSLALILAAVGIYGVMSYSVTQRRREIGVRMALGAESGDILKLIVGRGLVLTLSGVGIGLAGALALTRLATGLLFGVSATDPPTFLAISALLTAVALTASFLPARRATKVDPMVALRYE